MVHLKVIPLFLLALASDLTLANQEHQSVHEARAPLPQVTTGSPIEATTIGYWEPECWNYPYDDVSYVPHPLDCKTFFICYHSYVTRYECPGNSAFNPDENVCDRYENVPEWTPCKTSPADRCRSEPTGTYIPDPVNCKSYYICAGGEAFHYDCPSFLYYDPIDAKCVEQYELPPDVPCSYGVTTRTTSTTTTRITTDSTVVPFI